MYFALDKHEQFMYSGMLDEVKFSSDTVSEIKSMWEHKTAFQQI